MVFQLILLFASVFPAFILVVVKFQFFKQLVLDIRLILILHYFILFLFGIVLSSKTVNNIIELDLIAWVKIILYFIVLVYAAIFAIVTNNIEDLEIDKLTNKNRPLVQGNVDPMLYSTTAKFSLAIALIISYLMGIEFFLSIVGISILYYLYSCNPFRLKRYVILAKFMIGLNSWIAALCGYYFIQGDITSFPMFWTFFILIPVSLMANFVDLKDTEGDRKDNINTLPVLFGEFKTKLFISFVILIAYLMVCFYFNHFWINLIVSITCIVHVFLLFRMPYKEKPLFILHNTLFVGLIVLQLVKEVL